MDAKPMTALEVEALAWSTLTIAPDAEDLPERSPTPPEGRRAVMRQLVGMALLAGAAAARCFGRQQRDPAALPPD